MNQPGQHHFIADHRRRLLWAGLVASSILILAASMIGVWVSLRPPAILLMPAVGPVTETQRTLTFAPHTSPRPIANVQFEDGAGRKRNLADFRGKVVLLNIWATWCAPCRKEMPTLDRLQLRRGSPDFEVVALSIDRDGPSAVKRFFEETKVQSLAIYVDATAQAGTQLETIGVPTTLLIDREGREVARYTGPKEWDQPDVIDVIERHLRKANP